MRLRNRKGTPASWPFWLLVLAWICANSPQTATWAVLTWIGEAHSFSHQQRLTSSVAHLLVGEEQPASVVSLSDAVPPPSKPAMPAGDALRKIELAFEETAKAAVPSAVSNDMIAVAACLEGVGRARPPDEPPRAAV